MRDHAILEVFTMMMEEPVFDTLRTREQLGYSVFNTLRLLLFNCSDIAYSTHSGYHCSVHVVNYVRTVSGKLINILRFQA